MTDKELTFFYLDTLKPGTLLKGSEFSRRMNRMSQESHFPDTYCRYMREWREKRGRRVECVNRKKSYYKVME